MCGRRLKMVKPKDAARDGEFRGMVEAAGTGESYDGPAVAFTPGKLVPGTTATSRVSTHSPSESMNVTSSWFASPGLCSTRSRFVCCWCARVLQTPMPRPQFPWHPSRHRSEFGPVHYGSVLL